MYLVALRRAGIEADAYATIGHVYCRVGEGEQRVETTCGRWFQLDERRRQVNIGQATAHITKQRGRPRKLNDVELVAKIYYNRGVACFRNEDFQQGLIMTRRSLRLDPQDSVAQGNVLAGINNWALCLCQQEEYARSARLLEELRELDPDYPTLSENETHLYRLWGESRLQREHGE